MFYSLNHGVFSYKETEEINNAFKSIDDKISSSKIPGYDAELTTRPISLQAAENWSTLIGGHQVNLLFSISPDQFIQGQWTGTVRQLIEMSFTDARNQDNLIIHYISTNSIITTEGKDQQGDTITGELYAIVERTDDGIFYPACEPQLYDTYYESIDSPITVSITSVDLGKVPYPPMSNITVNGVDVFNSRDYATATIKTDGSLELSGRPQYKRYFYITYNIP